MVEIPRGSRNKYEASENGEIWFDRRLGGPAGFPGDYGYVIGSAGEDGDADALAFCRMSSSRSRRSRMRRSMAARARICGGAGARRSVFQSGFAARRKRDRRRRCYSVKCGRGRAY